MAEFAKFSFSNTPPFPNPSSSPFSFNFSISSAPSACCGSTTPSFAPSIFCCSTPFSTPSASTDPSDVVSAASSARCGLADSYSSASVSCGANSSFIARSFSFGATSFSASSIPFMPFGSASSASSSALSVRFGSSALTSTTSTSATASITAPIFGHTPPASSTGILFLKPSPSSSDTAATPTTPAAAVALFSTLTRTPPAAPSSLATTSFSGLQASTSALAAVCSSTSTDAQTSNAVALSSGNVTSSSTESTTATPFSASNPLTATPTSPAAAVPLFCTPTCTFTSSIVVSSASPASPIASSQPVATSTIPSTFIGLPLNSSTERMQAASPFPTITTTSAATTTALATGRTAESLGSLDPTMHHSFIRGPARSRTRRRLWNRGGRSKVGRGSRHMQRVLQQRPHSILDNEANQIGNKFVYMRQGKRPLEEDETIKVLQHPSFTVLSSIPESSNMRMGEWIEPKEATLPDSVLERITGPAECKGERYDPQWDVNPNESLGYDFPEHGGTLGHRMLKGMILPRDRPRRVSKSIFAKTSHLLAQFCGSYLEVAELGLHYQRDNARLSGELFDITNKLKHAEHKAADAEAAISAAIAAKEAAEKHWAESEQSWNLEKFSLESNIADLKKQLLAVEAASG